jgi:hypothetical protein
MDRSTGGFLVPRGTNGAPFGGNGAAQATPPASDFVLAVPKPATLHNLRVWSAVGMQTSRKPTLSVRAVHVC